MQFFDTHKFFFTLNYNNEIKNHKVLYINRDDKETLVEIEKIEVTTSPVTCKIYDKDGNRHIVPYLRVKRVYFKDEIVWEPDSTDKKTKIIKGYKK